MRVITAVNESDTYMHFIPTVTQAWAKMFGFHTTIAFVTERDNEDPNERVCRGGIIQTIK